MLPLLSIVAGVAWFFARGVSDSESADGAARSAPASAAEPAAAAVPAAAPGVPPPTLVGSAPAPKATAKSATETQQTSYGGFEVVGENVPRGMQLIVHVKDTAGNPVPWARADLLTPQGRDIEARVENGEVQFLDRKSVV